MHELTMPVLLNAVKEADGPVGATFLSGVLKTPPATVGRMLKAAEDKGYLVSVSNKGRRLTMEGLAYLAEIDSLSVKKRAAEQLIDSTADMSLERVLEVLQLRRLIEPYTAALACQNATDEELDELEILLLEHSYTIRKGGLGNEQDLKLHLAIAKCSGNSTICHVLELLLTENGVYTTLSSISSVLKRTQLTQHDELIHAIRRRDSEGARYAMEVHLDQLINNAMYLEDISKKDE